MKPNELKDKVALVTGAFLMCRSFVPQMKGQGYGRMTNMTR